MLKFKIQGTPNPNARKYVVNQQLKTDGKVSYKHWEECEHVPLAASLLCLPAVKQVHFFQNVVTVSQDGSMDWGQLDEAVQSLIATEISGHDPSFVDFIEDETQEKTVFTGDLKIIDDILDESIRPSLQLDGGDIEPITYEENVLSVSFMGACGDCPSSLTATLSAIEAVLKERFNPEIQVVVL